MFKILNTIIISVLFCLNCNATTISKSSLKHTLSFSHKNCTPAQIVGAFSQGALLSDENDECKAHIFNTIIIKNATSLTKLILYYKYFFLHHNVIYKYCNRIAIAVFKI
ncbi:MAG: hypothetical protein JSU07_06885 [Bacteroidetes bacterium]|nr:hypothetical protein [Bacteroidota bacterium]